MSTEDDRNRLETVDRFVQENGNKMGYTVAFDRGKTHERYMGAFGVNGIPHCFLIDKEGLIAWHGHPGELEQEIEERVTSGYDPVTYKKVRQVRDLEERYFRLAGSPVNRGTVKALGKQILLQGATLDKEMNAFALRILTDQELQVRYYDQAVEGARIAVEVSAGKNADYLATHALALAANDDFKGAAEQQAKALTLCKDATLKTQWGRLLSEYQSKAKN